MLTKSVDVSHEEGLIKELLALLASGAEIVLTEGETPVARLVPFEPRTPGLHAGAAWVSEDFDQPLKDEFWSASGG